MHRRNFLIESAALAAAGVALAGCATTATTTMSKPADAGASSDKRRREIDTAIDATLPRLYQSASGSQELVSKASGVLVFPRVIAAGFVVGGQYGEGGLRVRNRTESYYSLASVSVGLQAGAQSKAIIFLFVTQAAFDQFRQKEQGWAVGADASVAVAKVGANGSVEVVPGTPVVAFVLTNVGLMANLTLEGTKISRLKL
jgi:lipid-binding SYLF domain-containing protein